MKRIGAKRKREQRARNDETRIMELDGTIDRTDVGTNKGTSYETTQDTSCGTGMGQCPTEIEKELEIDKDIEKREESHEESDVDQKGFDLKYSLDEIEAIKIKLEQVIGLKDENVEKQCLEYLKVMTPDVIKYAISVTSGAQYPCWNYAKKVLENYKAKKLYTLDLLIKYLNEKSRPVTLPKNKPKPTYEFMEDMHMEEEFEKLYDN